jgi:hypothetical protein
MDAHSETTDKEGGNDRGAAGATGPVIDEDTGRRFDNAATQRCGGDIALWLYIRAFVEGEYWIWRRGEEHFRRWVVAKKFPEYKEIETSVIEGWRTYVENTLKIPKNQQTDSYLFNCALFLDRLRQKRRTDQAPDLFKKDSSTINAAASRGDVDFFRRVGRVLNETKPGGRNQFEFSRLLLSHWLTSYLWLMPEKIAAEWLARWLGVENSLRRFRAAKHEGYALKSYDPSLINHIEKDGTLKLTAEGRRLFSSCSPKKAK